MFSWFGIVNYTSCTKVAGFAEQVKNGRLTGSRCRRCGYQTFPPRADCPACLSGEFEFVELDGRAKLLTFTRIDFAPTGFEKYAPYLVCLVELEQGGRAVAWAGESLPEKDLIPDLPVRLVPRIFEEVEPIKLYLTIEKR